MRFFPWLFLLFPVLELWVLIQVGTEIGALATVGLLVLSTGIGIGLLRLRGAHIARTMQAELAAGRLPSGQIMDSLCLMAAGWLFLFPGFVSDAIAVLLIIPGVRHVLMGLFVARMRSRGFQTQTVRFETPSDGQGPVTWTCAAHTPKDGPPESPELRGNAVVIDCEPEDVTGSRKGTGPNSVKPNNAN